MRAETAEAWGRGDRFRVYAVPEGRIYHEPQPWPSVGLFGSRCACCIPVSVKTALYWRRCRNRAGKDGETCWIHGRRC